MSVRHFLHHHCHHPLLLLSSTPGSKRIFSTNPFLHSSTFPPTGLTPQTPVVFWFFSGMSVFSERELKFRFAICRRPSVCRLSVVCLSVVCRLSSVTFLRPTQAIEIFGNVLTLFGILAIRDLCVKILRRSSQGNPSGGGLNRRGVAKYSDFGPFQGNISETMQDRR